jgi:hypothetical protein
VAVNPAQVYETTILDRDTGAAARFIVVPSRSIPGEWNPRDGQTRLDVTVAGLQPMAVPHVLGATFLSDSAADEVLTQAAKVVPIDWIQAGRRRLPRELVPFIEYLSFAEVIPFEASPLDAKALATVVTGGSGAAVGGYVGFLVSG